MYTCLCEMHCVTVKLHYNISIFYNFKTEYKISIPHAFTIVPCNLTLLTNDLWDSSSNCVTHISRCCLCIPSCVGYQNRHIMLLHNLLYKLTLLFFSLCFPTLIGRERYTKLAGVIYFITQLTIYPHMWQTNFPITRQTVSRSHKKLLPN